MNVQTGKESAVTFLEDTFYNCATLSENKKFHVSVISSTEKLHTNEFLNYILVHGLLLCTSKYTIDDNFLSGN